MWTPKRVLILLGGLALFISGYLVYAYFLGGIDGLPLLSEEYLPDKNGPGVTIQEPIPDGESEKKLKWAFGPECEELRRPIKLDLRSKGVFLAASQFDIEPDGRVKLSPFSAALFPKSKGEVFPEINTVQCEFAYLTLDRPVANLTELSNRKIVGVELRGNRGVTMVNNRRSAEKNDDIELLITNGPLFYEEAKDLIWTDGYVQLLDTQTQPHPTKITAKGMELKLAANTGPNRPKASKTKAKSDASDVEMLTLKSNVDMHLYVDASSGFLAGPGDFKNKQIVSKAPAAEKSQVTIKTNGPFHYDVPKKLAWFDSPPVPKGTVPAAPEQVLVSREHKIGDSKKYDQLLCDHLELQFREKPAVEGKTPREGQAMSKDIDTALATTRSKDLVLTMDTENLEAYGSELHYRSPTATTGAQTILKGSPLRAVKDGHKIEARELHLISADKIGNGQQAFAKGPGQIDMFDKSNTKNPYPTHAVWRDSLILVRDRDGDKLLDVLTMTGNASFVDEQHKQELHGQRIQVWLESDPASAGKKRELSATSAGRQKVHKIEAFEKVTARAPDLIVHHTNHLSIRFKNEPGVGAQLPDALPASLPAPMNPGSPPGKPQLSNPIPEPAPTAQSPAKKRKPVELRANEVVAYIASQGDKKELQELITEGAVQVRQEGETPKDKGVDITGEMLNLIHHPRGDTLFVFGDPRQHAKLQLGELFLTGPKVTINQKDNIAEVEGAGMMSMPSNTSFDGGKPTKKDARIEVYWNKDMLFNGKFADFHGGVQAYQENAAMKCQDLYVTLDRVVSFKEGQKENQGAKVEKMVCDLKVAVEDKKKDAAGKWAHVHRLNGTQLTMDNLEGPIIAIGNGKVEHLAPAAGDSPLQAPRPTTPGTKTDQQLKLTRILFEGRMFSNNKDNSRNAKFYNNVEVFHFPSEDPDAQMNPDSPPKDGFYMRCNILNVFTRQIDGKSSQMMMAQQKVFFRTQEFFGNADVVKYDESQEQVIFEGSEGNPATLYQKRPGEAQLREIKGSKILYNRKTGVFQLEGGKVIMGRLETEDLIPVARLDAYRQDEPFLVLGLIARHDG